MEHLLQKEQELIFYGYTIFEYPEEWRPIECFDIKKGLYLISNYGRVYSMQHNVNYRFYLMMVTDKLYYKQKTIKERHIPYID